MCVSKNVQSQAFSHKIRYTSAVNNKNAMPLYNMLTTNVVRVLPHTSQNGVHSFWTRAGLTELKLLNYIMVTKMVTMRPCGSNAGMQSGSE